MATLVDGFEREQSHQRIETSHLPNSIHSVNDRTEFNPCQLAVDIAEYRYLETGLFCTDYHLFMTTSAPSGLGDLRQRSTNGRCKSTLHHVKAQPTAKGGMLPSRCSISFFVHPDPEAVIDPVMRDGEEKKYNSVVAG